MQVKQVGGAHYGGVEFQHWDFVIQCGTDYLTAVATKYLARWRQKGGVEDLKKSLSYVDKLIAACHTVEGFRPTTNKDKAHELWSQYLETYPLEDYERGATYSLFFSSGMTDLESAHKSICSLIAREVFTWCELQPVVSRIKPDGWQGFTFEGMKEDFCWHRCGVCREQFKAPIDAPPMLYHTCPQKTLKEFAQELAADVVKASEPLLAAFKTGAMGGAITPPDTLTVERIDGSIERVHPRSAHGLGPENGFFDDDFSLPTRGYIDQ